MMYKPLQRTYEKVTGDFAAFGITTQDERRRAYTLAASELKRPGILQEDDEEIYQEVLKRIQEIHEIITNPQTAVSLWLYMLTMIPSKDVSIILYDAERYERVFIQQISLGAITAFDLIELHILPEKPKKNIISLITPTARLLSTAFISDIKNRSLRE